MQTMHRLTPDQLQLHDAIPWDIYDLSGKLLLRKGFVLDRSQQIDMLLDRGMFVDAESYRATSKREAPPPLPPAQRYDPLSIWQNVQHHLGTLFKDPPQDGSFPGEISALARQVSELCEKNADLAIAALMLMDYRKYPVAHSLHVAVLAQLVARRAQWDAEQIHSTTCAALTMNIAMAELQQFLCNQRTPLTPEQREQVDTHPAESVNLLIRVGVEDEEWLRAVLEHHEEPDGSGYPRSTDRPAMEALLLHTCDVFAAKVSPRAHRKPVLASEAVKRVFVEMSKGTRNPFPALLVKEIGIYPPGTIVKLANGEVGVVARRGAQANSPIVATLVNAKGLPQIDPVKRDTAANPAFQIVAVMPREKTLVGLNFERIWRRDGL